MTNIEIQVNNSINIRVITPDGVMFVTFIEHDEDIRPIEIIINLGKAGSATNSWAFLTTQLFNKLLGIGIPLQDIMVTISNISSSNIRDLGKGIRIRSGPEGLWYACHKYLEQRNRRLGR